MATILLQWCVLLVTCIGCGYWVFCLIAIPDRTRFSWFYSAIAGFSIVIIALQNAIYLGIPLKYSAWVPLIVSLPGIAHVLRRRKLPTIRLWFRQSGVGRVLLAMLVVSAVQSFPLFRQGPANYYGTGHADQGNYVLVAQFLIDEPFSLGVDSVGLHPWLVLPIWAKNQRIGQSVCHGYAAVVSRTDAKTAYGAVSIFFLALLSAASYVLFSKFNIPPNTALLSAVWIGILPSLTRLHLDGFFSNVSTLFCFPVLCAILSFRRVPLSSILLAAVIAGYIFAAYAEMYLIALAISGVLLMLQHGPFVRRAASACGLAVLPFILLPRYFPLALRFLHDQFAAATNPHALESIFPDGGTLIGWGQLFSDLPTGTNWSTSSTVAVVTLLLATCAFFSRTPSRRIRLFTLAIVPGGILISFLMRTQINKYPFAKISISFAWLWCMLVVLGLARLAVSVLRKRCWIAVNISLIGFLTLAFHGTYYRLLSVATNQGNLAILNSQAIKAAYNFTEQNPGRTYAIRTDNDIAAAWLSYHARDSNAYVGANHLGAAFPTKHFQFNETPRDTSTLVLLTQTGYRDMRNYEGPPDVIVHNPQGVDMAGTTPFYWIGDRADIEVTTYYRGPGYTYRLLRFAAGAGPANPRPDRVLRLSGEKESSTTIRFSSPGMFSVPIALRPGTNVFTFEVIEPKEQTFHVPMDPRKHMVGMSQITIGPLPADASTDAIKFVVGEPGNGARSQ